MKGGKEGKRNTHPLLVDVYLSTAYGDTSVAVPQEARKASPYHKNTCSTMVTAPLFIAARNWNNLVVQHMSV